MRLIVRNGKFVCVLLIMIQLGSVLTDVVFADDEPKTAPAGDERPKKVGTTERETVGQSESPASERSEPQEQERRALPAPLDPLFPGSDYLGPTPLIGVPDTDPEYPLVKALWSVFPALKAHRIKGYGWANPGFDVSTSNKSNIPEYYAIVPNRLELDQGVVRIERVPDTVQTHHVDWGFRVTPMYGERDAILVDTFLSVQHSKELVDWRGESGRISQLFTSRMPTATLHWSEDCARHV